MSSYFSPLIFIRTPGKIVYADDLNNPLNAIAVSFDKLLDELRSGLNIYYAPDTGTANVYEIDLDPPPEEYTEGLTVWLKAANASTGASTLNVNSLGAIPILKIGLNPLAAGDVTANYFVGLKYTAGSFQIISQSSDSLQDAANAELSRIAAEAAQAISETEAGKASDSALDALVSADLSESVANFKGNWSAGTYTLPSSVYYNGKYWQLLVASSTEIPGTGTDYADIIVQGLIEHLADMSNPHQVTKAQVGLGNVANYSYTTSYLGNSSTLYATQKALYDGLATQLSLSGGTMESAGVINFNLPDLTSNRNMLECATGNLMRVYAGYQLYIGSYSYTYVGIYGGQIKLLADTMGLKIGYETGYTGVFPYDDSTNYLGQPTKMFHTVYSKNGVLTSSDEGLKTVSDIGDCSWILDVTPISFRWKDDPTKVHYGVSAQDLYDKSPKKDSFLAHPPQAGKHTVRKKKGEKDKNGKTLKTDTEEDVDKISSWAIAPTELIFPMLQIIKEQKSKIEGLESRLNHLEYSLNK